jgi:Cu/Ag efflux protein CusF
MRTHLTAVVTLALAAAACRTAHGTGASGGQAAARKMEGRVEEVGRDDGTITLRVGDARREVLVVPEAEIRIDDFKGTFEDIEEGQRVRASFEEVDGQTEGFRIEILDQGVKAPGANEPESADDASSDLSKERRSPVASER